MGLHLFVVFCPSSIHPAHNGDDVAKYCCVHQCWVGWGLQYKWQSESSPPTNMTRTEKSLSSLVLPATLPKPTVVREEVVKYKEVR